MRDIGAKLTLLPIDTVWKDGAKMVAGRVDTKPAEAIIDDRQACKYWLVSLGKIR